MKVILPVAGEGKRLRPYTHTKPKQLLLVAGKPAIDHIMQSILPLKPTEICFVTGHLKHHIEHYMRQAYPGTALRFIEQTGPYGTATAVYCARDAFDEDVIIDFGDTIFDTDLSVVKRTDADGIIWVKEVEDYQRFGVVVADKDGNMTRIVEKPSTPISRRANIGLYYVKNWKLMYEGIDWTLKQPKNKGEYYLTDAFQYMIDHGAKIKVIDVEGWYDAGEQGTLLETNRTMLEKGGARRPTSIPSGVRVIDPVYIEDGVALSESTIGPNVSLSAGSRVERSELRDTIVGEGSTITNCALTGSMIGDAAVVDGVRGRVNVADHSVVKVEG
jgi:glucose-1-phosphate thymidylyltransferase